MRHAVGLVEEMRAAGVAPNVITYNAAFSACEKGGQWECAVGLMEEMRAAGVAPDVITYNAAISACEKGGQWEHAVGLMKEMTIGYCRVCVWVLTHRCLDNVQACSPSDVCSARVNRELQRRARSNGYSVMVSAEPEEHGSVNELVPYHRVVSGVVSYAQTSASRLH